MFSAYLLSGAYFSMFLKQMLRGNCGSHTLNTDCRHIDSSNTHTCSGNNSPVGSGHIDTCPHSVDGTNGTNDEHIFDHQDDSPSHQPRTLCCSRFRSGCCGTDSEQKGEWYCSTAIRIDESSRKLFPLAFVMFNIFYWSYYNYWS